MPMTDHPLNDDLNQVETSGVKTGGFSDVVKSKHATACSAADVEYIELNMNNYDEVDVDQLNQYGIFAVQRIESLESALRALIQRAGECDGWESFPSVDIEAAQDVLNG